METIKAEIVTPVHESGTEEVRVHHILDSTLIAIAEICGGVTGLNDFVYLDSITTY